MIVSINPHSLTLTASTSWKWPRITALCKKLMNVECGPWQLALGGGGGSASRVLWLTPSPACPHFVLPRFPVCPCWPHSPSGPPVEAQLCPAASDRHNGRILVTSLPMVMESLGLSRSRLLINTH